MQYQIHLSIKDKLSLLCAFAQFVLMVQSLSLVPVVGAVSLLSAAAEAFFCYHALQKSGTTIRLQSAPIVEISHRFDRLKYPPHPSGSL